MQQVKRIFITGTNRGLGSSLVQLLHKNHPQAQLHISSRSSPAELTQQWQKIIPNHHIHTYQIDLNSHDSIAQSVKLIQEKQITFDYIVANAAVGCDYGVNIPSPQLARQTLTTNVSCTIDFVKQFLTLLTPNGRVVIVSSFMGALDVQPEQFRARVGNPAITEEEIIQIANDYIKCAEKKDMKYYNWSAYRTSKALINAWARFILPKYLKAGQTEICLHPGWCQTDMGGKSAALTPEQGAQRISNGIWMEKVDSSKFFNQKFVDYYACQ